LYANGKLVQNYDYSGSCPVKLKFDWGVISTFPGKGNESYYRFTRSDGSQTAAQELALPPNVSVDVTYTWDLGAKTAEYANYKGWVNLFLETPPVNQKINFTLHCK
jgi:hypothetical protein